MFSNTKKPSLEELIDKIEWVLAHPGDQRGGARRDPKELVVKLKNKDKNARRATHLVLNIGEEILKELDWDYNQKFLCFFDKENALQLMMVPSTNGRGHKMTKPLKSQTGIIRLKWPHPNVPMDVAVYRQVEHIVHKDKLLLKIPSH